MVEVGEDFFEEDVETLDLDEHSEDAGAVNVYGEEVGIYHLGPESETFQTAMEIEDKDYDLAYRLSAGAGRNFSRIVNRLIGPPELDGLMKNITPRALEAGEWAQAVDNTKEKMASEGMLPAPGTTLFTCPDPEEHERFRDPLNHEDNFNDPNPSVIAAEIYRDVLSDPFKAGIYQHANIFEGPWHEYCLEELNGQ
jgi:hypothetical protein